MDEKKYTAKFHSIENGKNQKVEKVHSKQQFFV